MLLVQMFALALLCCLPVLCHGSNCNGIACTESNIRNKRQMPENLTTTPPPPPPKRTEGMTKPTDDEWILGYNPEQKSSLVQWLLRGCWGTSADLPCKYKHHEAELPGYDGWYNNPAHPELGAVDTPLLRRVPAYYADGVYEPVVKSRPNPLTLSETFMKGNIGSQSRTGKTALLVFFGQQVVEEILDAQRPACPPEYFNIDIPKDHEYHTTAPKHTQMPLLRTRYDMRTGFSPGNPRQQLNEITPWLDGGLTYGTSKAWADQLRRYANGTLDENGLLAGTEKENYLFPEYNTHRLPLANPPPPAKHAEWVKQHETAKVNRFFKLGNPRGNENPFLLTFGVLWFRWHNALAREIKKANPMWSSERVFNEARKWVIASHQSIVVYEWLPSWLGQDLDKYKGYNPALDPQIDQFFQSAAMRFGHTLVVPGVYLRDYVRNDCNLVGLNSIVRTCNFFWRPQEPMLWFPNKTAHGFDEATGEIVDIDRFLMGMATQLTEEEDHIIVEDLRGRVFGPLEFSRRDLMAINIQRARDHGLPDYNTARRAYGLQPVTDVSHFNHTNNDIRTKLKEIYTYETDTNKETDWLNHIDVWVGGLLETGDSPGELFTAIIKDQFTRIRDADRFWFENSENHLFTQEEMERLRNLRLRDIIMTVTKMDKDDMQQNPFLAPRANEVPDVCKKNLKSRTCTGTTSRECLVLPPITSDIAPKCVAPNTYDYFSNSEISYILTFVGLTIFIGGLIVLLFTMHTLKENNRKQELQQRLSKNRASFTGFAPYSVQEWLNKKEGWRSVVVLLNAVKRQVEICSQIGELLRAVDLSHCDNLQFYKDHGDGTHLLLRVSNNYDLLLRFDTNFLREGFLKVLEDFVGKVGINRENISIATHAMFKTVVTRNSRQKRLEMFFRVVFSQAFPGIKHSEEEVLKVGADTAKEVIYTELTLSEFAEALSMRADSGFAKKMFALADKDKNGFISFREFVDMLVIFSKGSAEEKVKLMFDMYDINGTGQLTREDFTNMLKSLMETVQADAEEKDLENVVNSMMQDAGLAYKDAMSLEDFQRLLREHNDKIEYARLNFDGAPIHQQPSSSTHDRRSFIHRARDEVQSIYGNPLEFRAAMLAEQENQPYVKESIIDGENAVIKEEPTTKKSSTPLWWLTVVRLVENSRWQIFWCSLYTLVLLAIFAERAYYYSIEREHSGLRRIAGYGVTVTRGAASAMMFTYSSLLLTMCRNIITRLRETFLNTFIPFDSAVDMHKYIAAWALIFTVMHSVGHAFNFYHIATQTSNDLTCLFRNYFHATHELPKFHYWCWQTITGVTGILLAMLTAIIFVFALPFARTHLYNWFWFTHSLYPIYYLLMILHGAGRLIQEPFFHYFFLGPCILYVLDSLVTLSRKKIEIPVVRAEILPSGVTMLEFKRPHNFEYISGQWVRVACPALNSSEYHPFTLSSSPNENNLSVHIRAVGPWTSNIRRVYDPAATIGKPLPKVYLDGPYGESHQDWYRYEVAVLVGGGIGVTPFASILKDIVFNANNKQISTTCKKVYFLWVTKTQKHFEWFVDILRELENADSHLVVSVHIFVTQFYEKFDLRTILLYICERHFQRVCGKSLFTGLKARTHFGRPNCLQIFRGIQDTHSKARKIGVFSCGPLPMTQQVDQACVNVNKETQEGPIFQHHFENF